MQRRSFVVCLGTAGSSGFPVASPAWAAGITESDAAMGVRAALERGAVVAVDLLGRSGGFLDNPKVRIALPGYLNEAAKLLRFTGQQKRVDELVTAMNRAAEAAVPQAKTLLINAVKAMSIEDAKQIVAGPDTSVTQFFAQKTRAPLSVKFLPIVTHATERVSLAESTTGLPATPPRSAWSPRTMRTSSATSPARRWTACT